MSWGSRFLVWALTSPFAESSQQGEQGTCLGTCLSRAVHLTRPLLLQTVRSCGIAIINWCIESIMRAHCSHKVA
jgi:hypothetical protein